MDTVTKKDLKVLRQNVKKDLTDTEGRLRNDFKKDLADTEGRLRKDFKEDLQEFREDAFRIFATKEDLKNYVTKDEF